MTERDRVLSYLQSQAAKLTVPELVAKVRHDADQMRDAMTSIDPQRWDEPPSPGEWSGNQIAAHIVTTGDDFARAIEEIVAGRPPSQTPIDALADDIEVLTAGEWWERHVANRERLFGSVLAADPEAFLDQKIFHPFFRDLNWREALLFLRVHDLDHARQFAALA
ncbi:MAG: DinB family protein [Actinobacteria bacterium]|nr:DinB family protein [Actinomycetota bacterium]